MSTTTELLSALGAPVHEDPAMVAETVYCHDPSGTALSVQVNVPAGGVQVKE